MEIIVSSLSVVAQFMSASHLLPGICIQIMCEILALLINGKIPIDFNRAWISPSECLDHVPPFHSRLKKSLEHNSSLLINKCITVVNVSGTRLL